MHPDAEGVFVPLTYDGAYPESLRNVWHKDWTMYDENRVASYLRILHLNHCFEPVSEDDQPLEGLRALQGWGEAWIPVKIKKVEAQFQHNELLKDFVGHYGILTYANSD